MLLICGICGVFVCEQCFVGYLTVFKALLMAGIMPHIYHLTTACPHIDTPFVNTRLNIFTS